MTILMEKFEKENERLTSQDGSSVCLPLAVSLQDGVKKHFEEILNEERHKVAIVFLSRFKVDLSTDNVDQTC